MILALWFLKFFNAIRVHTSTFVHAGRGQYFRNIIAIALKIHTCSTCLLSATRITLLSILIVTILRGTVYSLSYKIKINRL